MWWGRSGANPWLRKKDCGDVSGEWQDANSDGTVSHALPKSESMEGLKTLRPGEGASPAFEIQSISIVVGDSPMNDSESEDEEVKVQPNRMKALGLTPLWEQVLKNKAVPPDVDKKKVFHELSSRLRDPEWEVRQHALRVLFDLVPAMTDDLDECMNEVLPNIIENLGHQAAAVRKGAMDVLNVYLDRTADVANVLRTLVHCGLQNPNRNVCMGTILGIPTLISPKITQHNIVYLVSSLAKKLIHMSYQEQALKALVKIKDVVGENKFNEFLESFHPHCKRDFDILCQVYDVTGSLGDSGIDLKLNFEDFPAKSYDFDDWLRRPPINTPDSLSPAYTPRDDSKILTDETLSDISPRTDNGDPMKSDEEFTPREVPESARNEDESEKQQEKEEDKAENANEDGQKNEDRREEEVEEEEEEEEGDEAKEEDEDEDDETTVEVSASRSEVNDDEEEESTDVEDEDKTLDDDEKEQTDKRETQRQVEKVYERDIRFDQERAITMTILEEESEDFSDLDSAKKPKGQSFDTAGSGSASNSDDDDGGEEESESDYVIKVLDDDSDKDHESRRVRFASEIEEEDTPRVDDSFDQDKDSPREDSFDQYEVSPRDEEKDNAAESNEDDEEESEEETSSERRKDSETKNGSDTSSTQTQKKPMMSHIPVPLDARQRARNPLTYRSNHSESSSLRNGDTQHSRRILDRAQKSEEVFCAKVSDNSESPIPSLDGGDSLSSSSESGLGSVQQKKQVETQEEKENALQAKSWQELGIVDQSVLDDLKDREDWKARVRGAEQLKLAMRNASNVERVRFHLQEFLSFLEVLLEDFNFKVVTSALDVYRSVVEHLRTRILPYLKQIVTSLCRLVGNHKVVVKIEAVQVFKTLMQIVTPKLVLHIVTDSFHAKSYKVRENALLLVLFALLTFPSYEFDPGDLIRRVIPTVVDPKRRVRQAALDCIAVLSQFVKPLDMPLELATDRLRSRQGKEALVAAVQARLARRQLPTLSPDGLILYSLQIPNYAAKGLPGTPSGADVDWILAGTGSTSSGSARSRDQLIAAQRGESPSNTDQKNVSIGSKERLLSPGRPKIRNPWKEEENAKQVRVLSADPLNWALVPYKFEDGMASMSSSAGNGPVLQLQISAPGKHSKTFREEQKPRNAGNTAQLWPAELSADRTQNGFSTAHGYSILPSKLLPSAAKGGVDKMPLSLNSSFSFSQTWPLHASPCILSPQKGRRILEPITMGNFRSESPALPELQEQLDSPILLRPAQVRSGSGNQQKMPPLSTEITSDYQEPSSSSGFTSTDRSTTSTEDTSTERDSILDRRSESRKTRGDKDKRNKTKRRETLKPVDAYINGEVVGSGKLRSRQLLYKGDSNTTSVIKETNTIPQKPVLARNHHLTRTNGSLAKELGLNTVDVVPIDMAIDMLHNGGHDIRKHTSLFAPPPSAPSTAPLQLMLSNTAKSNDLEFKSLELEEDLPSEQSSEDILFNSTVPIKSLNGTRTSILPRQIDLMESQQNIERFQQEQERLYKYHQLEQANSVELPIHQRIEGSPNKVHTISSAPAAISLPDAIHCNSNGMVGSGPIVVSSPSSPLSVEPVPPPTVHVSIARPKQTFSRAPVTRRSFRVSMKENRRTAPSNIKSGTFPETLPPYKKPGEALQVCLGQLDSSEWEIVLEGLQSLVRLTRHHPEVIQQDMHRVIVGIVKQIKNLRSQVSRAACQAASELFMVLKKSMENDLEEIVGPLLHRTADTNRFIREDCNNALDQMVENCNPCKTIQAIITKGACHQNAMVRTATARLLGTIVNKVGPEKIMSQHNKDMRNKILRTGANFLTEGSLETRKHAKQIFMSLVAHDEFDRIMAQVIPPHVMRNIQKSINNIKKEYTFQSSTYTYSGGITTSRST